jgi:F-type H+-transporting ATPase subunit delta
LSSKPTFSNSTSASYALALYELSQEKSEVDKNEITMKNLKNLLIASKDFKETILNPIITKEDKGSIISEIGKNNNFSDTLKNFLGLVSKKNRLFFLDKIIESFLNLVSKNKGELKAKLISSKILSADEQNNIQKELSKDFKSELNIEYKHDPSLIAGLIIQVGSIMIDTSIKTKLQRLERSMIEA